MLVSGLGQRREMIGKLVLGFWILGWICIDDAAAQKWPTPLEESLDELHDAEIPGGCRVDEGVDAE